MIAPAPSRLRSEQAARLFHALSDGTRLAVLELLRGGEQCVCDLQGSIGAAQSRLSFHLKVLREAGLVTDRKQGRWSYYSLDRATLEAAEGFLSTLGERNGGASAPRLVQLGRGGAGAVRTPAGRGRRAVPVGEAGGECCG
jgi:ArsR family transcriptional regulator, arsenate/arsenite/antimonite-responsive transcriptional repressor